MNTCLKPTVITVCLLLFFHFSSMGYAGAGIESGIPVDTTNLLIDMSTAGVAIPAGMLEPGTLRYKAVRLNVFNSSSTLRLNLFPEFNFIAPLRKTERQGARSSSWVGRLENYNFGFVILTETDGVVWGKIETGQGALFMIKPIPQQAGIYLLVELAPEERQETCIPLPVPEPDNTISPAGTNLLTGPVCDPADTCSSQTADLLIVYTADARDLLGGTAAAESAIAAGVTEMNLANVNSNVSHTFNLVHTQEVNYTESGDLSVDLVRLRVGNDGFMDEVHDLREQYYADAVSLIVGNGGGNCGIGYLNVDELNYTSASAFSCVDQNCLTTNKSLIHELGHNLGAGHDRYAYVQGGGPLPDLACTWAYGWVNPNADSGTVEQRWRTIMSYNDQCLDWGVSCTRIPYWSNPDISYNGEPMGSAIGNGDEANLAYLFERSFCKLEGFRSAPECTDCVFYQACEVYNPLTSSGIGNTTAVILSEDFVSANINGPDVSLCINYYGDHSAASETFMVYGENGLLLGETQTGNDCYIPTRVCFTVSPQTFNDWTSDGEVLITLDPTSTAINPALCATPDRACVEILVPNVDCNTYPETREVNGDPIASGVYLGLNTITSAAGIAPATTVIFQAGRHIYLAPGFHARAGSNFNALIQACSIPLDAAAATADLPATIVQTPIATSANLKIFPNPTNSAVTLSCHLAQESTVALVSYSLTGQIRERIFSGLQAAGVHRLSVNTSNWPPGIYIIRMQYNGGMITQKLIRQ